MRHHPVAIALIALATASMMIGCASPPPASSQVGEQEVRTGRISRIEAVQIESDQHMGLGLVLGGIAGGVLGHQFGGGTGQTVATVAGTLGGAVAGQAAQNKYAQPRPGQHVIVTLSNGVGVGITQPPNPDLHAGDNVRIEGTGAGARVVRN